MHGSSVVGLKKEASSSHISLTKESLASAAELLAARDRSLASIYELHGPPPMWGRQPGFRTLLRIVLEQQISLISARSMFERLKSNIDPFEPQSFIECGETYLRSLGMTRQKAHYAIQVAHAFTNGDLKSMIDLLMAKWEALEKEKEELESALA